MRLPFFPFSFNLQKKCKKIFFCIHICFQIGSSVYFNAMKLVPFCPIEKSLINQFSTPVRVNVIPSPAPKFGIWSNIIMYTYLISGGGAEKLDHPSSYFQRKSRQWMKMEPIAKVFISEKIWLRTFKIYNVEIVYVFNMKNVSALRNEKIIKKWNFVNYLGTFEWWKANVIFETDKLTTAKS